MSTVQRAAGTTIGDCMTECDNNSMCRSTTMYITGGGPVLCRLHNVRRGDPVDFRNVYADQSVQYAERTCNPWWFCHNKNITKLGLYYLPRQSEQSYSILEISMTSRDILSSNSQSIIDQKKLSSESARGFWLVNDASGITRQYNTVYYFVFLFLLWPNWESFGGRKRST